VVTEWVASDAPVQFCSWHHAGGVVDWPPEYRAWAALREPHTTAKPALAARHVPLRVLSPPDGATYLIDPTLRTPYQSLKLRATAHGPVQWHVDEQRIAASEWPLRPGAHTITAIDSDGHRDSVRIVVK
jgi:membrane carboxypeptidase/penicillin-binding protein PbpC